LPAERRSAPVPAPGPAPIEYGAAARAAGLIAVGRSYVGEYCTSLDMAGCSITLSRLDDEIVGLLSAPAEIAIRTF
jgi:phosphoenolpyruvate---glycerone phosphotransferase subunit DhaK